MRLVRVYYPLDIPEQGSLVLDKASSHYIQQVLRLAPGHQICLFNGNNREHLVEIIDANKHHTTVLIQHSQYVDRESPLALSLYQGLAKGKKMDVICQKATELGISELHPMITERCVMQLKQERSDKRLAHWQAILQSACEQCGRNVIPQIYPPEDLASCLQQPSDHTLCLLLNPDATHSIPFSELKLSEDTRQIALFVGPEGGFSPGEIDKILAHGAISIQCGPRILRTETAALVALSILQFQFGDFSRLTRCDRGDDSATL